jgi:NADPH2:quinone reductase
MRAMIMRALGEPEQLELAELPDPAPGPGQVAIDVEAIGCNYADILICRGKYQVKPELPFAPGSEVAGTVRAVGPGVTGLPLGARVLAQVSYGAYASVAIADARRVHRLPDGMAAVTAASFGVVYQTSYLALVERAQLKAGETLLVHAAAGGVGLAALQIGKALGARVIAGASTPDKLAFCTEQGADAVLCTGEEGWPERVRELTDGRGADVIYDSVGGDVTAGSLKHIAWNGRLLVIGFAGGTIPSVALNRVMLKNISIVGLNLGSYHERAPDVLQRAMQELFTLVASRGVRPHVHGVRPMREAAAALRELEARKVSGKLVLVPA